MDTISNLTLREKFTLPKPVNVNHVIPDVPVLMEITNVLTVSLDTTKMDQAAKLVLPSMDLTVPLVTQANV